MPLLFSQRLLTCLLALLPAYVIAQSLPASAPTSTAAQAPAQETPFVVWYDFWTYPKTSAKYPRKFFIGLTSDGRAWKIFESRKPEGPYVSLEALLLSSSLKKNALNPAYKKNPFPKVACSSTAVEGGAQPCSSKYPELASDEPERPDPWAPNPANQPKNAALQVGVVLLTLGSVGMVAGTVALKNSDELGEGLVSFGVIVIGAGLDVIALVPLAIHAVKKKRAKL